MKIFLFISTLCLCSAISNIQYMNLENCDRTGNILKYNTSPRPHVLYKSSMKWTGIMQLVIVGCDAKSLIDIRNSFPNIHIVKLFSREDLTCDQIIKSTTQLATLIVNDHICDIVYDMTTTLDTSTSTEEHISTTIATSNQHTNLTTTESTESTDLKAIIITVVVSILMIIIIVAIYMKCRKPRSHTIPSYMSELPHSLVAANDRDSTVYEMNELIAETRAARVKPSIKTD